MYLFRITTIDKENTPNVRYVMIPALENNKGLADILILQNSQPHKSVVKLINVSHILWSIKYIIYFLLRWLIWLISLKNEHHFKNE